MATCKKCGKTALEWKQEDNGHWWLFDPSTDMAHLQPQCEMKHAEDMAEEIARTAVRPVIQRGMRVKAKGKEFTGTIVALTAPKPASEVIARWNRRTRKYGLVIKHVRGDVLAMVNWDDAVATAWFKKWVNTRNLTVEG